MAVSGAPFDLKLLYYGPLEPGSTSRHRYEALARLLGAVAGVDCGTNRESGALRRRLAQHVYRLTGLPIRQVNAPANRQLIDFARVHRPDILWLDKPLDIAAATLDRLRDEHPRLLVVGYSPDDMGQRHNRSPSFDAILRRFDMFFTTKSFGVAELTAAGCPRAHFIGNGFDPQTHAPVELGEDEREAWGSDVSFVGTYERARAISLLRLAEAGLRVRVWGNRWERGPVHPNLHLERRAAEGRDFARVACASRINLGFLRKLNRDQQTTRSVELPACGAFTLAERTDEHRALFEEGREAEFFADDDEMIAKCRHYLADEPARQRIAAAGRARCLAGGYRNDDRLAEALAVLQPLIRSRHDA